MTVAPDALSAEELLRRSRPTPVERWVTGRLAPVTRILWGALGAAGAVWLVVGDPSSVARWLAAAGLAAAGVLVGRVMALVVSASLSGLGRGRTRPFRRALARRLGQAGIEHDVRRARDEAAAGQGPETVVLFRGEGLPLGRCYWIRLTVDSDTVVVTSRVGPRLDVEQPHVNLEAVRHATRQLDRAEVAPLLHLIGDRSEGPTGSVKSCHITGFPCEIALIRRGSPEADRGGCNLFGLGPRRRATRVVRLIQALLDLHEGRKGAWEEVAGHALASAGIRAPGADNLCGPDHNHMPGDSS